MKKILFLFILLITCGSPAGAADILIVQSARIPAYEEARQGFVRLLTSQVPARGLKRIQPYAVELRVLSEAADTTQLRQEIIARNPDLLLTIGSSSLSLVKGLKEIPVIYLLVPYPETLVGFQDNITGIRMTISPARQLDAFRRAVPGLQSIGVIYDPERTGHMVQAGRSFAERQGFRLLSRQIADSREVLQALNTLRGEIDGFWMLPDLTVVTPRTVDHILLFSLENRIPILTFSSKYLEQGATMTVTFDPAAMGEQAAELAGQILAGAPVQSLPAVNVDRLRIRINQKVAEKLGIRTGTPNPSNQQTIP